MSRSICPVWIGYLLASPLRKLIEDPKKILAPHVREGDLVLDVGCAMGFYSLPLARMVGPKGKVACVDVQEKMLSSLRKRAHKAGLSSRIETRTCNDKTLGLEDFKGKINFALASAVVHEVPKVEGFFADIWESLINKGELLVMEPKGHVSEEDFFQSMEVARKCGFELIKNPPVSRNHTALLLKN